MSDVLGLDDLTSEQVAGVDRLFEFDRTVMVAAMGFGKTVVGLTAISELLGSGVVKRVLIVAPLKVCGVWSRQRDSWDHLRGLDVRVCGGNVREREAVLGSGCRVVVINFEQLVWLFRESIGRGKGFDGLVIDELSRMRNSGGRGFKALRGALKRFVWRVGMTGTPVSEDFEGLYGQMLLIDDGAALGSRKDRFLSRYFESDDYMGYSMSLREGAGIAICEAVREVCWVAEDYRDALPVLSVVKVDVGLSARASEVYRTMRRDGIVKLESGAVVVAGSEAVKGGKLEQLSGGFLYADDGVVERFDSLKAEAVVGLIDSVDESDGGVVVCYWFTADRDLLAEVFRREGLAVGGVDDVEAWNRGELDVLLIHPRSGGHGLQLERGGSSMVWYSVPWSRDLWLQTVARIWRRGQRSAVRVWWLAGGGIDSVKMSRGEGKAEWSALFDEHVNPGARE